MSARMSELPFEVGRDEARNLAASDWPYARPGGTLGTIGAPYATGREIEPADFVLRQRLATTHAGVELGGEPKRLRNAPHRREGGGRYPSGIDRFQRVESLFERGEQLDVSFLVGVSEHQLGHRGRPGEAQDVPTESLPELRAAEVLHGVQLTVRLHVRRERSGRERRDRRATLAAAGAHSAGHYGEKP